MAKPQAEVEALNDLNVVPDCREVFAAHSLTAFSHYVEQRIAIAESIKDLEVEKKRLDSEITALMTEHDAVKVQYQGRPVSLCQGSRSSLNKEKLLQKGVLATTILECTDQTKFTYLLIGRSKT